MTELMTLRVPGTPEYIKITEIAVASVAALAGFDVEAVEDIKMATGEACKHITCHGFDCWSEHYEVYCTLEDDKMTVTITDVNARHELPKTKKACLDCPQEGDLSFCFIQSMVDAVQIKTTGNQTKSIIMVKNK
jgi:serine/threonine-protein kinase RsbW